MEQGLSCLEKLLPRLKCNDRRRIRARCLSSGEGPWPLLDKDGQPRLIDCAVLFWDVMGVRGQRRSSGGDRSPPFQLEASPELAEIEAQLSELSETRIS